MSFEPLAYLLSTVTVWHLVIWIGLASMPKLILPKMTKLKTHRTVAPMTLWMIAMVYGIFALIFGQLFGDKFKFLEVFPSGFLLGAGFMLTALVRPTFTTKTRHRVGLTFGTFGLIFAGVFFGTCIWLFPRVIGFGLIDLPKYSWAVVT